MSNSNPFEIILVITGILLMCSVVFAIVAPSLGVDVPDAPVFPKLNNLNAQGNLTGGWAFGPEIHQLSLIGTGGYPSSVKFTDFNPDKQVNLQLPIFGISASFQFQRYGSFFIVPYWQTEPISNIDGSRIPEDRLYPQQILNAYNGSYSTFIIDDNNNQYMAYASFSPLPGYSTMLDSWNTGKGFSVTMYGNAYAPPVWTDQVVNYLTWIGAVIAYFIYFAAYILQMAGLMITVLTAGFIPTGVSSAIIMLVSLVFIGSILMYLRGSSGGK